MSEIRQNKLTGEWVIIAPERAKRGGNLSPKPEAIAIQPHVSSCPFCPGNETVADGERFRTDDPAGHWSIRSVVNKFSVLSTSSELPAPDARDVCGDRVPGVGLHEVLVESPEHHLSPALFSGDQMRSVVEAYRNRFAAFYADPRVRHVIVFKNHGADAGASQQHPHSQIVGIPIVPRQVTDRVARAQAFFAQTGRCPACTMLAEEQAQGSRVVGENERFIAFIPYAALSPYHLWIFPKDHAACFSEGRDGLHASLAEILHLILKKVHGHLADPAFNLIIRSLGPTEKDAPHFHWYVSVVPRINRVAGFELGTGMYVNPSWPEDCAKALRDFRA